MFAVRTAVLMFALTFATVASAMIVPTPWVPARNLQIVLVEQEIPSVVLLLAQRAARAERRGDLQTANELYDAIRELGYIVRREPRSERGGRDEGRGAFGGGRDSGDDDDDDGDDDGGDDGHGEGDGDGDGEGDGDGDGEGDGDGD